MTNPTLFLIAGCIGFGTVLAIFFFAACRLAGDADALAEQFEQQLPHNPANKARIGNGRVRITHHRKGF